MTSDEYRDQYALDNWDTDLKFNQRIHRMGTNTITVSHDNLWNITNIYEDYTNMSRTYVFRVGHKSFLEIEYRMPSGNVILANNETGLGGSMFDSYYPSYYTQVCLQDAHETTFLHYIFWNLNSRVEK